MPFVTKLISDIEFSFREVSLQFAWSTNQGIVKDILEQHKSLYHHGYNFIDTPWILVVFV